MDLLKRLGGFLGGLSNQAQRTIGGIIGGTNQAVKQAQRAFQPVAQQVQRNLPRPPVIPRIQMPTIPKIQLPPTPQFRPPPIPQAPRIDFNAVGRALNNTYAGREINDLFNANSAADIQKRLAAGQAADYRTQQIQAGNLRPYQNVGAALTGNTSRYINTAAAASKELQDTINIGILQGLGQQGLANRLMNQNAKFKQQMYQPNSGLFGQGTIFNKPEEFGKVGAGELSKRVALNTLGTAFEVTPLSKGAGFAGTAGYKALSKPAQLAVRTAAGAAEGAAQDVAEQQFMYNKFRPEQTLAAAVFGGSMPNVGPALSRLKGLASSKAASNLPGLPINRPLTMPSQRPPSMYAKGSIGSDVPESAMRPKPQVGKTAPIKASQVEPTPAELNAIFNAPKPAAISKSVNTAQINEGQKILNQLVNERAAGLGAERAALTENNNLFQNIKELGGIKSYSNKYLAEETRNIPAGIRNNNGITPDDMAAALKNNYGYDFASDGDLLSAISDYTSNVKPSKAQLVEQAKNELLRGNTPESEMYLATRQMIKEMQATPVAQPRITAPKVPVKAAVTDQIAPGDIKISSAIDSKKPDLKARGQEVREQLVNRFAPVEDLVSKIEKQTGTPLRPSKNPLSYVRQYLGGGGIANSKIDNELTPIIRQTKEFDGLREFLVAKRMNELADRGMSKRADNVLEGINKKYGAEVGNFEKIATELYAYQNKQIDELVNVGVLTRQAADNIRAQNQFYVPFNRVIPELEDFAGTTPGQAIGRNANPIKAIHGSDKDIIDPIESMIRNTYDIQATVQKQKVMRSLYELAPDEFRVPAKNTMNKNRVGIFIDGQKTMLETSEPLARTLNSMAEEQMNLAVRVMSLPARALRSGATSLNVAFALPNILRDQLTAAVNSKYGGIPIYDFVSGLASVLGKDDSYKRWITSGADQASFFAQDRTTLQRGVKDITGGLGYKAGKLVKNPLELFRVIGEFSEKGSRVGVYKRAERGALKQFGSAEEAALAAAKESREATIDFARRGSKMKAANSLIPFLNARLQGTLKLANSFRERPVQTSAIGMAIAGLPSAALYLHNSEYPEYAEIPDYITRENFIIMTGNKQTPFIKIPKGEVGKIFGNPVESFLAQLKSDDPSWKSTVTSMVDSFLPIGSVEDPSKFVTDLMPTAASVPLQIAANFDTFRGMPIVSQYQKDLPPEQQFTKYNTETGKKIGAALGISPAVLEFGIGGFTGGLGRQALQLADIATGNKIATQDLPVISRFAGEQKDLSKSANKVYEDAEKAKISKARENFKIKQALEKGDTSVLEGVDKSTATRLKRTVAENQAKDKLTPIQKALFGLSRDQLDQLKQTGQYTDDIAVIEGIKETITQNIKEPKPPKIKISKPKRVSKGRAATKGRKGRKGRVARASFKLPKFKKVSVGKAPRIPKAPKAGKITGFAKLRPTKSARKTINIKTG